MWAVIRNLNLDAWGATASALCAAHCLVMPLALALLPSLALGSGTPADAAVGASCCASAAPCCAAARTGTAQAACCDDPSAFWIHAGMLACTLPLAGFALVRGFTCHRQVAGLAAGGTGLLLLATALPLHSAAPSAAFWCNISGSALLVSAHLWNWGKCACSRGHAPADAWEPGITA